MAVSPAIPLVDESKRGTRRWVRQINRPQLPRYTVATVPSAAPASQIAYITDEAGGATVAFSDGTNWRRVQDRAVIS